MSEQGTKYFLPKIEIKDCDTMIEGRNIFDQPVKIKKKEHIPTLQKLFQAKVMATQPSPCFIMHTSKKTTS